MTEDDYVSRAEEFLTDLAHGTREAIRTVAEVTKQPAKDLNEPIYNFFNQDYERD